MNRRNLRSEHKTAREQTRSIMARLVQISFITSSITGYTKLKCFVIFLPYVLVSIVYTCLGS